MLRYLTFVLLTAILGTAMPLQQLFHKHHFDTIQKKDNSATSVKKQEKHCCKSFDGLFGDTTPDFKVYIPVQPLQSVYLLNYFQQFIKPFLQLSNKAPPVSLA